MNDPTPSGILKLFRVNAPPFNIEQVDMFNSMAVSDRLELLFYMALSTNGILQFLHQKVVPGEGLTEQMPDLPTEN